ncbi:hypothetical protein [Riemerella anatipestifer]|uniref:hypothetical protein n=1 Tax=Riemerella anatipestifer TaxID=34085 RepID=UPI001BDB5BFF|nr:hypothetical protein [Riemerella anatipestifer]MCO7354848.1 hypothetical protein [Riemerella anatipestifer]
MLPTSATKKWVSSWVISSQSTLVASYNYDSFGNIPSGGFYFVQVARTTAVSVSVDFTALGIDR